MHIKQACAIWRWLLVLWLLLPSLASQAQNPTWQSALPIITGGSSGYGTVFKQVGITTDISNNVYISGYFSGNIQLGSVTLNCPLTESDGFIAKWSAASQSFVWAKQFAAQYGASVTAITVTGSSIYITGAFHGAVLTVDNITLPNSTTGNTYASYDMFIMKLVDTGFSASVVWAKSAIGDDSDTATTLVATGNTLYVAGSTRSINFQLGGVAMPAAFGIKLFVIKLVDTGATATPVWGQLASGAGGQSLNPKLAVSGSAIYVGGEFDTPVTFGSISLTPSTAGVNSLYLAKLIDNGTNASFIWAQQIGSPNSVYLGALAARGNAIYLAGTFSYALSTPFQYSAPAGGGLRDITLLKAVDNGSTAIFTGITNMGSIGNDQVSGMLVQGNSIYLAGTYSGPVFTCRLTSLTVASVGGSQNIFLARLVDMGSYFPASWLLGAAGNASSTNIDLLASSGTTLYVLGSGATFSNLGITRYNVFLATVIDAIGLSAKNALTLTGLSIAPNPAHGTATVRVPAGAGPATLTLLDALGRTVRTASTRTGQDYSLDLTGLAPGVYALRVQVGEGQAAQRLVVE